MAAINFPTATSNGQTFTADTGVIYTYIGTPPNGFWSGTFGTTGLATLDARFVALNDGNSIQTMQTQGLKFNNGSADTILLDGVNGKVGIGTTSVNLGKLEVKQSATTHSGGISVVNPADNSKLSFWGSGSVFNIDAIFTSTGSYKPIAFRTGNGERMRIDGSGNVKIGTGADRTSLLTAASSNLQVDGGIVFEPGSGNDAEIYNYRGTSMKFGTSGTERMRIDSSGRVGISRNAPDNQLSIGSTASFETDSNSFYLGSNFTGTGQNFIGSNKHAQRLFFNNATNNGYLSYANTGSAGTAGNAITWQERVRIDSSGRVGIGDNDPQQKFSVLTTGPADRVLNLATTAGSGANGDATNSIYFTGGIRTRWANAKYEAFAHFFHGNGTEKMRIDSSGRVGMGSSSPADRLHVKDSNSGGDIGLRVQNNTSGANSTASIHLTVSGTDGFNSATIKTERTSGALIFERDGNERMRIDSSGTVGIGCVPSSFQSGFDALQIGGNLVLNVDSTGVGAGAYMSNNVYRDSGNSRWEYINTDEASQYLQANGEHVWRYATSGSANSAITWGEAMRIDSSGRLLVGTSSARTAGTGGHAMLQVKSPSTITTDTLVIAAKFQANTSQTSSECLIACSAGYDITANDTEGHVLFGSVREGNGNQGAFLVKTGTSNTERMRIDSSGRLLVGESHAIADFSNNLLNVSHASGAGIQIGRKDTSVAAGNSIGSIQFRTDTGSGANYQLSAAIEAYADLAHAAGDSPGRLTFSTTSDGASSPAERLRITNTGDTCFGITSHKVSSSSEQGHFIGAPGSFAGFTRASNTVLYVNRISTDGNLIEFRKNGADKGSISVSGSSTSYNTSSDYRLKENVVDLTAAIPRLKSLSVYRFNFIEDTEKTVDGFLAHEAQLVVPEAVTGTHNEVDGDGNPVMQSIDQAKLVPLLTAALQEAIGRIETLETEVAALKAG